MKTNFKKIAILAGTAATMAAGSMSAHAVVTAVPAPAQLIPLFYTNSAAAVDTNVRITVPKSVGADTIINLLGGSIPVATSWSTTSAAFTGSTPSQKIHFYVMSQTSKEVFDGTITVTPDDEYFLKASALPGVGGVLTAGAPYYLILTNESANLGGTPVFSFAAEAWLQNNSATAYMPEAVTVPVLGLADTADSTSYPTPTNNVIEAFTSAQGGPVSSPIITGIRMSSTTSGLIYRVVDVPFVGDNGNANVNPSTAVTNLANTLVAWNDRNGMTGRLFSLSSDEVLQSLGPFSLPNQLNIVKLGNFGPTGTTSVAATGILDSYTSQISNIGSAGTGCASSGSTGCVFGNGFLKLVIDANALPTPATGTTLAPGAYSSTFMFTIPANVSTSPGTAAETGSLDALDTGFFTTN